MTATNAFEGAVLNLIFANANIADIGDAIGIRGSSTNGVFYISLHTADPGEAGTQSTNEATYTSYARVSVPRSGTGWSFSGNSVVNAATIAFPSCTGGSNTITHFGIGTDASGAGNLLFKGALTASLAVSSGTTPSFPASSLTVTAD